jgi:hypothetical protein
MRSLLALAGVRTAEPFRFILGRAARVIREV